MVACSLAGCSFHPVFVAVDVAVVGRGGFFSHFHFYPFFADEKAPEHLADHPVPLAKYQHPTFRAFDRLLLEPVVNASLHHPGKMFSIGAAPISMLRWEHRLLGRLLAPEQIQRPCARCRRSRRSRRPAQTRRGLGWHFHRMPN